MNPATRSPMNLEISPADPSNALELSDLALEAKEMWNYPADWLAGWLDDLRVTTEAIDSHPTYIGRVAGELVGFYQLRRGEEKLWLEHLWVRPRYARKGIGAQLYKHALAEAARLGIAEVWIEADPNAEGFYLKVGAHRVGERPTMNYGGERRLPILCAKQAPKSDSRNG